MDSKNWIVRYVKVILDICMMFIAYVLANKIKFGRFRTGLTDPEGVYMTLFLILLISYFVVLFLFFSNDNLITRNMTDELFEVLKMHAYVGAVAALYIYFSKSAEYYSREQMGWFFAISYVLVFCERQSLKRFITKSYHRSGANEKIMLVTTSDQVQKVVKKIKQTRNWYFRISNIAILDRDLVGEEIDKIEVVAKAEDLEQVISTSEIDSVFLHIPEEYRFPYRTFIENVQEMGKKVHLNIDEYETAAGSRYVQFLGKFAVVTWNGRVYRIRYVAMKRFADILAGVLGTVCMLAVYPFAALGHAIEGDHGHTIISYVRVGKNGRRFYQYRFRSLYANVEEKKTAELSKTGKVLKMLGLTNLPMAWNVLWGDMSLVGAEAPSLPKFLDYSKARRRGLSVKPGVIQFWPAYYWRRVQKGDVTIEECENEYIENWSVWLDVKVIVRTIGLLATNWVFTKYAHSLKLEEWKEEKQLLLNLCEEEAPVVCHAERAKGRPVYRLIKRGFDITASLLGLIVLSLFFLLFAFIIKWQDGGSAFYSHMRIGYRGKKIHVYKFRSMKANVGDLEKILTPEQLEYYRTEFKIENDPRVTRFGSFLRRTSIDELPQLWNILKGDLSIVGPRPIVQEELEIYGEDADKFLSVKPGLTGYWQAYARNNATYESGERQRMEMYYIDHQSLWLDIKILFRTVFSVAKGDGAM